MKRLSPAGVRPEPAPATATGTPFLEAAGKTCLWPLAGAGADMLCCGAVRTAGSVYCLPHLQQAEPGRLR